MDRPAKAQAPDLSRRRCLAHRSRLPHSALFFRPSCSSPFPSRPCRPPASPLLPPRLFSPSSPAPAPGPFSLPAAAALFSL
eukprot:8222832-Heterocapsa_arctica.AAC.1